LETGVTYRDNIRRKFIEILQTTAQGEEDLDECMKAEAAKIALKIEDELNGKYKDIKGYSDKARSLVFNFKDPKNQRLRKRIISGDLSAKEVVTLSAMELASENKK